MEQILTEKYGITAHGTRRTLAETLSRPCATELDVIGVIERELWQAKSSSEKSRRLQRVHGWSG